MTSAAQPFLSVEGLAVEFPTEDGRVQAVDGVSFSVERGKTLAIVGESGSGKSVTAQAIMGLLDRRLSTVTGHAWLQGRDLVTMSDDEVRQCVRQAIRDGAARSHSRTREPASALPMS